MIFLNLLMLVGGLIYLLIGADFLVRGAVATARRANVSPMVVAITVVALGTSLPELVVSVHAAVSGFPGIVLGNVVGSNIANVLLVGGASAIIYPLAFPGGSIRRDSSIMLGASLAFGALALFLGLGRISGVVLLAGTVVVFLPTVKDAAEAQKEAGGMAPLEAVLGIPTRRHQILMLLSAGLVGLPMGADLVVKGSVEIAVELGVSEAVVGLTIIAFSTSLPELATTMVAAFRRETDVAVGTLVGSNIFNLLGIMGLAAVVSPSPVEIPPTFAVLDFPVMLAAAALMTAFVWLRRPVGRKAGILLSLGYVGYLLALVVMV